MRQTPSKRGKLRSAAILSALAIACGVAAPLHAQPPRAATPNTTQAIDFAELAPNGFSVVVPDAKKAADAWSDILGVPVAQIFEPQAIVYPPRFDGDRPGVGPTIALLMLANMSVTLHQPPPGRNYWRSLLDAHGQTLYRLGFAVHGLAGATSWFEHHGGTLALGDPARSGYVNVNLWPRYGFAIEMNDKAPNAAQRANPIILKTVQAAPTAPATPDPAALAANPVTTIAFVVPDLRQAIGDYAALFGIPPASAIRIRRPPEIPLTTAALRLPNGVMLELNQPKPSPSPWRTHLRRHGRSMISIGFRVKSLRDQLARLQASGGRLILGGAGRPYAYVEFTPQLGTIIEFRE